MKVKRIRRRASWTTRMILILTNSSELRKITIASNLSAKLPRISQSRSLNLCANSILFQPRSQKMNFGKNLLKQPSILRRKIKGPMKQN